MPCIFKVTEQMKVNLSFLLALPFYSIFVFSFFLPLVLTFVVSFWDYTDYSIIPDFILSNYHYIFEGCLSFADEPCLTLRTYASHFVFLPICLVFTLILGFTVSFFFSVSRALHSFADWLVSSMHDSVLDIKRHQNYILDTPSGSKWNVQ